MLTAWRLASAYAARVSPSARVATSLHPHLGSNTTNNGNRVLFSTGALHPSLRRAYPRWINSKTGQEGEGEGGNGDVGVPKESEGEGVGKENEGEAEKEPSPENESSSSSPPTSSSESADSNTPPPPSSPPDSPSSNSSSSSSSNSNSGSNSSVIKPSIPSSYPYPLLALPIARRPLFPGFYKAVVIRDPAVVAAIKEMMKRGQPYLGAFLLKDKSASASGTSSSGTSSTATSETATSGSEKAASTTAPSNEEAEDDTFPLSPREAEDKDVISSLDDVHDIGVFCQVTSVFAAAPSPPSPASSSFPGAPPRDPSDPKGVKQEEALTAVLYPHRRIRITDLVKPGPGVGLGPVMVNVQDEGPVMVNVEDAGAFPSPPGTPVGEKEGEVQGPPTSAQPTPAAPATPTTTPTSFLNTYPVSLVRISNLPTLPFSKENAHIQALTSEIVSVFKDIAQLNPLFRDQITNFSINQVTSANIFDEPDKLADFAAAVSAGSAGELQSVLESTEVEERLGRAVEVLKKERVNAELQSKLARDVDGRIARRQREYYLMEQMRGIKKELGLESDGKDKLILKLKERAGKVKMPGAVRRVFEEELAKLAGLEPAASEANVTRNYLDWLTALPWGVHTPENYDLAHARSVLDSDHYGLSSVKDRILEFLAVGKLRGTVEGKILCLVGPPGVGKTSVGKSVARCVGRRFVRFSVGGLTDVAEVKGHRRTYVGALPGKIVQSLKRVATENPVVVIDEIDKIGKGYNGDPASALLEMLDPEQNASFMDHYLDVPIDLSRVLFVCTANTLDTIPAPLLDRMEVLEVSGYVSEEKSVIARRYLAPQAKESCGLGTADVEITEAAVDVLIKWYARESGVRNLKKYIEKIYRKAALKLVEDLGESAFPEPKGVVGASPAAAAVSESGEGAKAEEVKAEESTPTEAKAEETTAAESTAPEVKEESKESSPVETSSSDAAEPKEAGATASNESTVPKSSEETDPQPTESLPKETTTRERKPMVIPSTVHLRITPENLKDYVGPPVYQRDRMFGGSSSKAVQEVTEETKQEGEEAKEALTPEEQDAANKEREEREREERERTAAPPGVSTGLGYLGNGSGAVMPIETVAMPGKGGLQLTGKLGEVIRESAQIAISWVKAHAFELGVTRNVDEILLDGRDVHIHMPEGGVGKDGPSAGTAILTALVSLVSGRRVDADVAMTGEMSLTGRVLAVGGLKEKILAAHRAEIKTILVPAANRSDVEENVPESVKEGIRFVYVESVEEVLTEVFGSVKVGNVKPEEKKWRKDEEKEKWKKEKREREERERR